MRKSLIFVLALVLVFGLAGVAFAEEPEPCDFESVITAEDSVSGEPIDLNEPIDLADDPDPITLTATTDFSKSYVNEPVAVYNNFTVDVDDEWIGATSNDDGYWLNGDYEVTLDASDKQLRDFTVSGTWVSTAEFDPVVAGEGEHDIYYSVDFTVYSDDPVADLGTYTGCGEATIEVVDTTVEEPPVVEAPAAPAIAAAYLEYLEIYARYGSGRTGGNLISEVALAMENEAMFGGFEKGTPEYEQAVKDFIDALIIEYSDAIKTY